MDPKKFKGIFNVLVADTEYDIPALRDYVSLTVNIKDFQEFHYSASWDDDADDPCNYCGEAGAGEGLIYFLGDPEEHSSYDLLPPEVYEDIEEHMYVCCCRNCEAWWICIK